MAVTTVYCTAETGGLSANKNNGDFDGCLSGAGSESWSDNQWRHTVGHFWHSNNRANINYMVVEFDLSSIPSGDVVSAVNLEMYGQQGNSATDFDINVAVFTPASPWDVTDWQDGTDLAAFTVLDSLNTAGFNASGYNVFGGAALTTEVDNAGTGTIAFILWSSRTESSSWPGSSNTYESVNFYSYGQSGTTQDPKLVITHAPGSSDTTIDAAVEALTITTQQASVALDVTIDAAAESLTLTTQHASIDIGTTIEANTEALTLTTFPASIGIDTTISAGTEALTLTTFPATVAVGTAVNAQLESLVLTTFPATLQFDVEIEASTESLTIAPQPAEIVLDVVVEAATEVLTITTLQAAIEFVPASSTIINAAVESLTLTTLPATIVYDVQIDAATKALQITTLPAVVTNPSQDTVINAAVEQLQINTLRAGIFTNVTLIFPHENRMTATVMANVHGARVDKIPSHFAKVMEDEFTYAGVV